MFASYFSVGARSTVLYSVPFGVMITALLSLKYGEGGMNRFDLFCIGGAALALFAWWFSGNPFVALVLALCIDFFAYLPTVKKSYLNPLSEDKIAWLIFWAGSVLNIFAIENFTLEIMSYPAYIFVMNSIVYGLLLFKKN